MVRLDDHFKSDSSKAERELGLKFRRFEDAIKDTIAKLLEIEKKLQA